MTTTKTALLKAKTTASTIHGKYIGIPTALGALPPKQITTVFACFHVPFLSNAHFLPLLYVERYICGAWIAFIVAWLKNHSLFTLFIYFYPLFSMRINCNPKHGRNGNGTENRARGAKRMNDKKAWNRTHGVLAENWFLNDNHHIQHGRVTALFCRFI